MTDYFVRTSGGNDSPNTGLSVAQGFDTIQKAEDTISAADHVFLCVMADGEVFDSDSYPINLITGDMETGWTKWSGANSTGQVDGTIAIVDGTAAAPGNSVFKAFNGTEGNYFEYIRALDGSFGWENFSGAISCLFWRCEGNLGSGGFDSFIRSFFIECLSSGVGARGFDAGSSFYIDCVAKNSGFQGFDFGIGTATSGELGIAYRCLAYGDGVEAQGEGFRRPWIIANCVAYNADEGIQFTPSWIGRVTIVVDSLFVNNTGYGIRDEGIPGLFFNNAFYNNGTDSIQTNPVTAGIELNSIDLPDDPFADAANEDYTLNNDPAGLLPRTSIDQGEWIKKPANLINSKFDDTNWPIVGNWTISNGVAHHGPGSSTQLNYTPLIIVDGIEYEVIFTISNYIQGSVAIKVGDTQGTTVSSNGIFREYITGATSASPVGFLPNDGSPAQFEADISDVLVAPAQSGPQGNKSWGGSKMTSYGARGIARVKDRRIKTG